jgi:hypothetical protein
MIGPLVEESVDLHDRIVAAAGYDNLPGELPSLCIAVAQSIKASDFPGALVPVVSDDGNLVVYAAAKTVSDWRRLNPILLAFAGPTLTSYTGLPADLPALGAVEGCIRQAGITTVGLLRLPNDNKSQVAALRALKSAQTTLARAPNMQRSAPEPTSWLLANFQDLLNVGRREAAASILLRLKEELRIDALNLKFLEVQMLATFDDWSAILMLPGFASLCVARRPPSVTAMLLEALYRVYIDPSFMAEDAAKTRENYEEHCRHTAQSMLSVPAPATLTRGGWRIYAIEATINPERYDLCKLLLGRDEEIGWLSRALKPPSSEQPNGIIPPPTPLNEARAALADVDNSSSLDAYAAALASVDRLTSVDLARLSEAEPFRSLLRSITDAGVKGGLPRSWLDWLAKVADPTFSNAQDIARQGKDEWPIDERIFDPLATQRFVAALEKAQNDPVAAERTANSLPFIVAWLRRDPGFPRPVMANVYSTLLTLFAMRAQRGRGIYESVQLLIHGLLDIGLNEKDYKAVIADTEELAGAGFGVEMIYWLLEVIEDLLRFAAPDAAAREAFLHSTLSKIAPIHFRLSALQRAAIARLAMQLGWNLHNFGVTDSGEQPDDLASKLRGLRVAIYSLTESSTRQAKEALELAAPGVIVDCNADHVGTPRLRALAENADLFVLTSLSAKHAATDFIRDHRSKLPLLYAQGRGFSSILRAVEDHLKSDVVN